MPGAPPTPPFELQGPVEYHLWTQLRPQFLNQSRTVYASSPHPADRPIRAAFLRWFLLEGLPAVNAPITAVKLGNVFVTDTLDLSGCKLAVLLSFLNCEFERPLILADADIAGLRLIAVRIGHIRADRLTARGAVEIRAPRADEGCQDAMRVEHQLRLNGAKIRGNLTLRGCQFISPVVSASGREPSVFADGLAVDGNLLLDGGFSAPGEIRLNGAKIGRNLDCSGAALENLDGHCLSAAGAHVAGSVYMCETQAWSPQTAPRRFTAKGAVRFDGATIEGDLDCRGGDFRAACTLIPDWRYDPAKMPELFSLTAISAHVGGDVYLGETQPQQGRPVPTPFESRGVFSCENARLDGDLDCRGGQFTASAFEPGPTPWDPGTNTNRELYAIAADGLNAAGNIRFSSDSDSPNEFRVTGCASLISAHVGRDFFCKAGHFSFPGEEPLTCDGLTVDGTTFFEGARTDGVLRFVQATLKQGFYAQGIKFDGSQTCRHWLREANLASADLGGPACGVYAPLAVVGATFYWQEVELTAGRNPLWLFLRGAKANAIEDDQASWEKIQHLDVTGCQYSEITTLTGDLIWRLRELDRAYVGPGLWFPSCRALLRALLRKIKPSHDAALRRATQSFKPQPYVQLADTLRRAGFEAAASKVLVRLERNRTRYSDFGVLRQLSRWALDLFLLYGQSPFRPLIYVLLVALLSTWAFQRSFDACRFVYAKDMSPPPACLKTGPGAKASAPQVPTFNALIYAVDTLVPIVDLNQKKSWVLNEAGQQKPSGADDLWHLAGETLRSLPQFLSVRTLIIFNTFFGWVMTTLFAAGVTGLTRTR